MSWTTAAGRLGLNNAPTNGGANSMDNHYRVHAYVCSASCVRYSPIEGFATFGTIFQQRPSTCRYVVVERPAERDFVVWDMFDGDMLARACTTAFDKVLEPPKPVWAAADPHSLVMKAVALYDRDS